MSGQMEELPSVEVGPLRGGQGLQEPGPVCTKAWSWLTCRLSHLPCPRLSLGSVASYAPGVECRSSPCLPHPSTPRPIVTLLPGHQRNPKVLLPTAWLGLEYAQVGPGFGLWFCLQGGGTGRVGRVAVLMTPGKCGAVFSAQMWTGACQDRWTVGVWEEQAALTGVWLQCGIWPFPASDGAWLLAICLFSRPHFPLFSCHSSPKDIFFP